jgi:superfamily II RNA helicase
VQKRALQGLLEARSVVVSAPTGSGKTLVAEAAVVATLAAGKRTIYTTPLKALSNQKLREFSERFGCVALHVPRPCHADNTCARTR